MNEPEQRPECEICGAYKTRHAEHCPKRRKFRRVLSGEGFLPPVQQPDSEARRVLVLEPDALATILDAVHCGALLAIDGNPHGGNPDYPIYSARITAAGGGASVDAEASTMVRLLRDLAKKWRAR